MSIKRKGEPEDAPSVSSRSSGSRAAKSRKRDTGQDETGVHHDQDDDTTQRRSSRYPPTSTYKPRPLDGGDDDVPIFEPLGLAFFSPFCPAHLSRLFAANGGRILDLVPISTLSQCAGITPTPQENDDHALRDVAYYFVEGPADPILPIFHQRPIVFFDARWVDACVTAGGLVSLEPYIIDRQAQTQVQVRVKTEPISTSTRNGRKNPTPTTTTATPSSSPIQSSRGDRPHIHCPGTPNLTGKSPSKPSRPSGALATLPIVHVHPDAFRDQTSLLRAALHRPARHTSTSQSDLVERLSRGLASSSSGGLLESPGQGRNDNAAVDDLPLFDLDQYSHYEELDTLPSPPPPTEKVNAAAGPSRYTPLSPRVPLVKENEAGPSTTRGSIPHCLLWPPSQTKRRSIPPPNKTASPSRPSLRNLNDELPPSDGDISVDSDESKIILDYNDTYDMMMRAQTDEHRILGLEKA